MEDGLGEEETMIFVVGDGSLNPCFSGGWSRSSKSFLQKQNISSLNPCFSGGWSRRITNYESDKTAALVLILVLVEDGLGVLRQKQYMTSNKHSLNPCFSGGWSRRVMAHGEIVREGNSLNPCFSGGWSRRWWRKGYVTRMVKVLILVLVEDGLGVSFGRARG